MFKRRKMLICLLIIVLGVSLFSTITAYAEEKKTLTVWIGGWRQKEMTRIVEGFEFLYDVDVKLEFVAWPGMHDKYLTAIRAGNPPDVMNVAAAWNRPWGQMGYLLPLDKYIESSDLVNVQNYYPAGIETASIGDHIYGIPFKEATSCLVYNKKLFEEAGLDPEVPPNTWEDFIEYSKKLTNPEKEQYGYGMVAGQVGNCTARLFIWTRSFGGRILNDDYTKALVNEPEFVKAVDSWAKMFYEYKVAPASSLENINTDVINMFINEKVAMLLNSAQSTIDNIEMKNPSLLKNLGVAVTPLGVERASLNGGMNIAIPKGAKSPDLAWQFIEWFTDPTNHSQYTKGFPSNIAACKRFPIYNKPILKGAAEQLNYQFTLPPIPQIEEIRNIIYTQAQYVLLEKKSAQEAMDDAAAQINNLLNE